MKATPRQRKGALVVFLIVGTGLGTIAVLEALHIDIGRFFLPCGIQQRYHIPCPTCGVTTAVRAFARGQIIRAFYIQPAAGLLCLILVVAALTGLFIAVSGVYPKWVHRLFDELKPSYVFWALVIIILAGWAVTLVRALLIQ